LAAQLIPWFVMVRSMKIPQTRDNSKSTIFPISIH
jgi:hypothetical protein